MQTALGPSPCSKTAIYYYPSLTKVSVGFSRKCYVNKNIGVSVVHLILCKETVHGISRNPSYKDGTGRFTKLPLKAVSALSYKIICF